MKTEGIRNFLRSKTGAVFRELSALGIVLGGLFLAETAFAQPFIVPSGSMEPTLQIGDEIFADKFIYGYSKYSLPFGSLPGGSSRILGAQPQRGDVVVFRLPSNPSQSWVKRVIGLPGDHVQMANGELFINGERVLRTRIGEMNVPESGRQTKVTAYSETLPGGVTHTIYKISDLFPANDTQEYVVPEDHYFVMGDNRDNSADSRFTPEEGGVGFLPAANLVGKAAMVAYSIHPLTGWIDVLSRPWDLRLSRFLTDVN